MPKVFPKADVYSTGFEHSNINSFVQFFALELPKARMFINGIKDFCNAKKGKGQLVSMAHRNVSKLAFEQQTSFRILAIAVLDGYEHFHVPGLNSDAVPQRAEGTKVIRATSAGFTTLHIGKSAINTTAIPAGANHMVLSLRPSRTRCVCLC